MLIETCRTVSFDSCRQRGTRWSFRQSTGTWSGSKRDSKYTEGVITALFPCLSRSRVRGFIWSPPFPGPYIVLLLQVIWSYLTRKFILIELYCSINQIKLPLTCSLCFLAPLQSPVGGGAVSNCLIGYVGEYSP